VQIASVFICKLIAYIINLETPALQKYPFLGGGGEMGELTRNFDWSATTVGSPDTWPFSLRTTVSNLLRSKFPMFLWWGPEMIQFYNDAYRPSMGNEGKHPLALGQAGKQCWPEIWDIISPLHRHVEQTGEATWMENQLVPIYRNGSIEDVYWTYSYSSVLDDDGMHAGILVTCTETTDQVKTLQQLSFSEQRYNNLLRDASVGIVILSGNDMTIELVNEAYGKLIDRTPDQLLGKRLFEDIIPEAKAQFGAILENVRLTGEAVYRYDEPFTILHNNEPRTGFVNIIYQPYREIDGQIKGVLAICQDVTEQVRARKIAEESAHEIKALIESAPFPIGVYMGREMRITFTNKSILDVWGKGYEVLGKTYHEVLPELEAQNIYQQLDEVFTTGIPFHAHNQRVDLEIDQKLTSFYFNYSFTPLFDRNGKVYGVMNTAADVTDLKLAILHAEQTEANLRNIILQAPVAMCLLRGEDHVVEIANDLMLGLWGKPAEEMLGKSFSTGLPEIREQGFLELLTSVLKTGKTYKAFGVPVLLPRDQKLETIYVDFVYEAYREGDGKISGVMAVATEVTEQVNARLQIEEIVQLRTRELAQANQALVDMNRELSRSNSNLEEFAHAASHDLKEPIRKINFFTQQLKTQLSTRLSDAESNLFRRIENAAVRMGNLIDDLLLYSHVSHRPLQMEMIDINVKLQRVLEDLELDILEKKATISIDKMPVVPGYRRQLQQLFQNLISNALKYSKEGNPPAIRITAEEVVEKNIPYHLIKVIDNGIGFDQEYSEKIFQMFTRLHGKSQYSGTGVGLSIVKKVVENHDGFIRAKSAPGEGAEFCIYLPSDPSIVHETKHIENEKEEV